MSAPMPSRVDPTLPTVDLHELVCPGCGQTLAFIKGAGPFLPEQHYRQPICREGPYGRKVSHVQTRAGHKGQRLLDETCEYNERYLAAVVFRAQRDAAGLGAPRLVNQ